MRQLKFVAYDSNNQVVKDVQWAILALYGGETPQDFVVNVLHSDNIKESSPLLTTINKLIPDVKDTLIQAVGVTGAAHITMGDHFGAAR